MVADQPVPRTKDDFERLLAAGRERIAWAVQELIALVGPIFEGYHQACLAIEELCSAAEDCPDFCGAHHAAAWPPQKWDCPLLLRSV